MDNRIEHRAPWMPWAATAVLLTIVAIVAYVFGTHQTMGVAGGDPPARAWGPHPFHPIFALIIFFWLFGAFRWMFWGGWGRPWRYRRGPWGHPYDDRWMEDGLADWHRREHERMRSPRDTSSSPDAGERPV